MSTYLTERARRRLRRANVEHDRVLAGEILARRADREQRENEILDRLLSDDRALMREILDERERGTFRDCPYCGRLSWGAACPQHLDLVAIENEGTRR